MTKPQPSYDRTLLGAGNLAAEPGSPEWAIAVRLRIHGFLEKQDFNAFHLENMISMMKEREGWRHLTAADGTPFQSYDHFAKEKYPFGLGVSSEKIDKMIAFRKQGGDRRSKEAKELQGANRTLKRGDNSEYNRARLKRDRPDILEALDRGEYPNPHQAAIVAGFVKEKSNLEKAQKAFEKLTKGERRTFLKWAAGAKPNQA